MCNFVEDLKLNRYVFLNTTVFCYVWIMSTKHERLLACNGDAIIASPARGENVEIHTCSHARASQVLRWGQLKSRRKKSRKIQRV